MKGAYRKLLLVFAEVQIVFLKGTPQLLRQRMRARRGHFMTEQMLESQLAALEAPADAMVIEVDRSPTEIAAEIRARLALPKRLS